MSKDPTFSEVDRDFDASHLSKESKAILDRAERTMGAEFKLDKETQFIMEGDGIRAGYKIELHFGPGRTSRAEYKALALLMESGKHFHGGGDGHMYFCLDHRVFEFKGYNGSAHQYIKGIQEGEKKGATRNPNMYKLGCAHAIPSAMVQLGKAFCTQCNRFWNAEHLTGQIPFYGTTQDLADMVEFLFNRLKQNADVYCKFDKTDIRYGACEKKFGYDKARQLRGLFIYPLERIIKDTANGSPLNARLKTFLSS